MIMDFLLYPTYYGRAQPLYIQNEYRTGYRDERSRIDRNGRSVENKHFVAAK